MKICRHSNYCKEILETGSGSLEECIDARNYLIFLVSAQNANRAGPLANMTVDDVRKSERQPEARVIHVAAHKTVGTYGGKFRS